MALTTKSRSDDTTSPRGDARPSRSARRRAAHAGLALLCAAALAACGGGGGGGGGDGGGGGGGGTTSHVISGRVEGLSAAGLVLQNNGADNLAIGAAGSFRFAQSVPDGQRYSVTVFTQPAQQSCSVANGSGTATQAVSDVVVTCASTPPPPPQTHTVGGSISGLTSAGLVLRNNGGDGITLAAGATSFTFPTPVARGGAYSVTIGSQPQGNDCTLANASGTIAQANVSNVQVSCGAVGPLTLVSSNPAVNATNVPRNVVPTLNFSAPLDPATLAGPNSAALFDVYGSAGRAAAVGHTATLQGSQLSLRPAHKLLPGVYYLAGVSGAVRGTRGERLPGGSTVAATLFTTADAAWGEPQSFGPAQLSLRPTLPMASSRFGDAVAAWVAPSDAVTGQYRLLVRTHAATVQQWGDAAEVASSGDPMGDVSAAVSDGGDAVVLWRIGGGTVDWFARHRAASTGAWGARVALVDPGRLGNGAVVAAHSGGGIHLVGRNQMGSEIVAITGRVGDAAAWQPVRVLGMAGAGSSVNVPKATALPDGGAMVVWGELGPGGVHGVVRARRLDAAGRPMGDGPVDVATLPSLGVVPLEIGVQPDPGGAPDRFTVLVAWRWTGASEDRIKLRRWFSNVDAWDEESSLAAVSHTDGRMGEPKLAVPPGAWAGERSAQLAWYETRADNGVFRLRGVALPDSGEFGTAQLLVPETAAFGAPGSNMLRPPQVWADRAGNLLVAYEHPLRVANGRYETELRALRRLPRAGVWAPATIAVPAVKSSREPLLAGGVETGRAWVMWWEPDAGFNHTLHLRRFD